jgi:hypothetical protein
MGQMCQKWLTTAIQRPLQLHGRPTSDRCNGGHSAQVIAAQEL